MEGHKLLGDQPETVTVYGVFNDEGFFGPKFDSGELHEGLRENLLDRPLWTSEVAGSAKRYAIWLNDVRMKEGNLPKLGHVVLRKQEVTTKPWAPVSPLEFDSIDDGRKANG